MTVYDLNVKELKEVSEVKKYYKLAANELLTVEEDMLFDEDGYYSGKREQVAYLRDLVASLRAKVYELSDPTLSDGVIDLYLDHDTSYTICEHDKTESVGNITYTKTDDPFPGNVAYYVKKEFRGKNYALRALRLVGEDLLKSGIKSIYITATNGTNEASKKIIEAFGGQAWNPEYSYGVLPYTCDLEKIYSK